MTLTFPTFTAGMVLSMSLIMAIGPQNAHVLRMGLQRQHLWLTVAVCALADIVLISLGVLGLAQLGGLSDKLLGALIGAGVLFLGVYGWTSLDVIDAMDGIPFTSVPLEQPALYWALPVGAVLMALAAKLAWGATR